MKKPNPLNEIIASLKKKYGSESAVLLSSPDFHSNALYGLSTQSLALDFAIGRPGLPCGRVAEISGLEGAGKSTLGEHLISECQRIGGVVCLIESEHGRDALRMKKMGIKSEELLIIQPDTLEEGFKMMESVIFKIRARYKRTVPFLILWDSIAQTQTQSEEKDSFTDSHIAAHAKLIAQACRKLLNTFAKEQVFVCFINQLKTKINVFGYGDPFTTFGGKAIAYVSSVTMRARRAQEITGVGKKPKGYVCKVKIWKNKLGDPKNEAEININYEDGIDKNHDLFTTAVKYGLFKKLGNKSYQFRRNRFTEDTWPKTVTQLGGPDIVREHLLNRAIDRDLISAYGVAVTEGGP